MLSAEAFCAAMENRISRRAYDKPVSNETAAWVAANAQEASSLSGIRFAFVREGRDALSGLSSSGMFAGTPSYVAVIGPDTPQAREACGFYGEMLLLTCVHRGLGTCWVAGSYSTKAVNSHVTVKAEETLLAIIVVGNCPAELTAREKLIYHAIHKANKPYQSMFGFCEGELPPELQKAMRAVECAPSARNKHNCVFRFAKGVLSVQADRPSTEESIDLGIARFHIQKVLEAEGRPAHWNSRNELIIVSK